MPADGNASASSAHATVQLLCGLVFIPLVCAVGIVGNSLCVLIFLKPGMRTSTNVYLLMLAFGDLLKLLNDLMYTPSVVCKYLLPGRRDLIYVNYYQLGYFLSQYSSSVAAWMTVAVAFERFLMVVYPTRSRGVLTVGKAAAACATLAGVVLLVNAPVALRYDRVRVDNSTKLTLGVSDLWRRHLAGAYSKFQSSFRSIVPLLILTFLNICIIKDVRKSRANRRLASRNRITVMLAIAIFLFITLALPDAVMTLVGFGYHEAETDTQRIIREVTDLLLTINSAHNFFLYVFFNTLFLETFLSMLPCVSEPRRQQLLQRHRAEQNGRRQQEQQEQQLVEMK